MKVGVVGAGIQGASIALELSRRGVAVDLYEGEAAPFQRASGASEGKLHLGFVYGNDPTYRTADAVIRGSLSFANIVSRWLPFSEDTLPLSTPFIYPVHRDTLVDVGALDAHMAHVGRTFESLVAGGQGRYIGDLEGPAVRRLPQAELERAFSTDHVLAAYQTVERSVDPQALAALFGDALAAAPGLRVINSCTITAARQCDDGRVALTGRSKDGSALTEVYDAVANAAWEGLVALDASFGVPPARSWLHRYKVGFWVSLAEPVPQLPSSTFVLGPFGDVVNFAGRWVYVSWYPICMVGMSAEPRPPDYGATLTQADAERLYAGSFEALATLSPPLQAVREAVVTAIEMRGGVIFAWGKTDIDDAGSELHSRHQIGVQSFGNYHSVNTGRYCTAPLFAIDACDRILGER